MHDEDDPLTPEMLMHCYGVGIFPMAEHRDDPEVFWVDPRRRGILPLDRFHISRSLARRMRRGGYRACIDTRFQEVLDACADRTETWINATIRDLFLELHARGHAHSFEIESDDGALLGGVYGLSIGAAFFGESMFSHGRDGSKIALAHLVDHLRQSSFTLFDTQFLTAHLASLGGQEITRPDYRLQLAHATKQEAEFTPDGPLASADQVLQRMTQTS